MTTEFFQACDLCGSFSFESAHAVGTGVSARRCRDCGTMVIDGGGVPGINAARVGAEVPGALRQVLKRRQGARALPTLTIGEAGRDVAELSVRYNLQLTALTDPTPKALDSAPFLPDQFDVVLCATGIEYIASPSSFFRSIRRWLAPSGVLLIGGANAGSLPSRLRRGVWVRRHAAGAAHLLGAQHLKVYAEHFGFEVQSLRASSTITQIASVIFDDDAPSILARALSAPIALVANAANLGDRMTAVCIKRGAAVKPMLKPLRHETERDTGLAPALFTSIGAVKREMV